MSDVNGWRVVNAAGELVPVRVWVGYCECGCKQSPTWVQVNGGTTYGVNRDGEAPQRDIRRKIGEVYPCAEIRAPGEMTTAERVAAAVAAEREMWQPQIETTTNDAAEALDMVDDLVRHAVLHHPLPWRVERDWTHEVTASDGAIIAKCMTHERAAAIVAKADAIRADLDAGAAEIEEELAAHEEGVTHE